MANMLSVDDATFAGGVGNWTGDTTYGTTLSTSSSPTSPGGNRVLVLTKTPTAYLLVYAQIYKLFYPTVPGRHHSLDFEYSVPGTNTGLGPLRCQALVISYATGPGAGTVEGQVISGTFNPGDGWHHMTVPDFAVGSGVAEWVGIEVTIYPDTNSSPYGFATGDVAYLSDVDLEGPELGGWGVGMVRMGASA